VIAAGMVVGTAALMILGVQPVLLGALADAKRISASELGPLATAEVLALAAGSAIGPAWMRAGGMRLKVVGLSLVLAMANLAPPLARSAPMLDALRALAGLVEGLLLAATIVVTIEARHPDRLNAIFLAVSTLPQAIMALFLPTWITPRFGADGGFYLLALFALASAAAGLWLPRGSSEAADRPQAQRTAWSLWAVLGLLAVLLQNAAIGGAWDYMDRLAAQNRFAPEISGAAVSGGLVVQVIGALAAAARGRRLAFRWALVIGSLCQAAVIAALAVARTPVGYVLPALFFGLFWLAMSPFQVRLLIAIDRSRTVAVLATAAALIGLSLGPSLSALGVRGADVTGAFWIGAGLMLVAFCVYALLATRPLTEHFEPVERPA
jgi:predicted MFS family arabinose efflux permease